MNLPPIGIGTYKLDSETTYQIVRQGLKNGYRLIDTAQLYQNEQAVGQAVIDSRIPRKELLIVTKINRKLLEKPENRQEIVESVENSLRLLQTEIDLLLLHAPVNIIENWTLLEEIFLGLVPSLKNKVKSIGVSNFSQQDLEILLSQTRIKPVCNQIELSPFCQRRELVRFCQQQQIEIMAHSSLTKGQMFNHPLIQKLSQEKQIDPANLLLGWTLDKGYIALPRTSNPEHLLLNFQQKSLSITELDQIDEIFLTHPQYPQRNQSN